MATIKIKYHKTADDDAPIRNVIPIHIPKDMVSAIDVTDLDDTAIENMETLCEQYNEYVKTFMQNMFTFTDWLDHMGSKDSVGDIKFRNFKVDKIEYM